MIKIVETKIVEQSGAEEYIIGDYKGLAKELERNYKAVLNLDVKINIESMKFFKSRINEDYFSFIFNTDKYEVINKYASSQDIITLTQEGIISIEGSGMCYIGDSRDNGTYKIDIDLDDPDGFAEDLGYYYEYLQDDAILTISALREQIYNSRFGVLYTMKEFLY